MTDGDSVDLSRREFMAVGAIALTAAGDGPALGQIAVPTDLQETADSMGFVAAPHLLGSLEARPGAGSDFFDDKTGVYVYQTDGSGSGNGEKYWLAVDGGEVISGWNEFPMPLPQTQIDEVVTTDFNSFLNHTFARPGAPDDKNWEYTGGDITKDGSEIELAASTRLVGKQRGNYPPGSEAIPGVAFRTTGEPTGGECFAGYFDDDDSDNVPESGMGFGADATGDFIFIAKSGTVHRVYQPDWNGESVDERPFNKHYPRIGRLPHLFYGGGAIQWRLVTHDVINGTPQATLKTIHVETPESIGVKAGAPFNSGPPIDQPNLPPAFTSNGLTGASLRANASHYNIGDTHAENRVNGEHFTNITVGTAGWTPLLSWQKRTGWDAVNIEPLTVMVSPRTNDVKTELQLASTVSGVAFDTPTHSSSDETAVEVATGGTLDAAGERRWPGYSIAGQANQPGDAESESLDFNLPAGETVTLAAQAVGGEATVYGVVAWEEYF